MKLTVTIDASGTAKGSIGATRVANLIGQVADQVPVLGDKLPQRIPLFVEDGGAFVAVGEAVFEATPGEYGEPA
jgi:hypothetical protein